MFICVFSISNIRLTLISIDTGELGSERNSLSDFLKSKIQASITAKGKVLILDSGEETLSSRNIKTLVKRFLHHKGLSEVYRVTEEKGLVKITKRKDEKKRRSEKKGTTPSSYDTLPYFFPNRP